MVTEKYKCIVCNSKQKKIFSYQSFYYYKCPKCDLISTYPLPNNEQIKDHYQKGLRSGNYKFLKKYSRQYLKVYKGFVTSIEKYLKLEDIEISGLKVLDIGCFTGEFLYLMSKKKADVLGVEMQEEAVKIANSKLPGKIINKNISENPLRNQKFDIITMFGLIEHVKNPSKLIEDVSKMMKKNGILVIQTPNSDSVFSKILGKYWPPFTPIEHIHLFGKKSIEKLLAKNGFRIRIFNNHVKILPIAYVYKMLDVFGPEIKKFLKITKKIYNFEKSSISLPFYIGEMFIIAKK